MFEGIALGLATTQRGVWLLLLAIGSHKFIISLCLGQQMVSSKEYFNNIFMKLQQVLCTATSSLTWYNFSMNIVELPGRCTAVW